tara:strand:- start:299 stop:556 length:258 start_codon:yes stop_codon:yes gene_type:complete
MPELVFSHVQSDGREIFFGFPIINSLGKVECGLSMVMVDVGARVLNWATRTRSAPCLALKERRGTWTLPFQVEWVSDFDAEEVIA